MRKHPYLPAVITGILDAALLVTAVCLITGAPGQRDAAAGKAAASRSESGEESRHGAVYSGVIRAKAGDPALPESSPEPAPEPVPEPEPEPAPEPEPTPEPEPERSDQPDPADFIFPDSSSELLTREQVAAVISTKAQCQRAVNEIFARHGYQFHREKNAADYDYFNSLGWYRAMSKTENASAVEAEFNAVEKANVALLLEFRSAMSN